MPYITPRRTLGQIAEEAIATGAATGTGIAMAVAAPGAVLATTASTLALAVPIIGGVAAAAIIILAWTRRRGAQKVAATQVVTEAEPLLQQNLEAYQSSARTRGDRQQALESFDRVWRFVVSRCSDRALGSAGERCISERAPGGRWDWFAAYRDPIAADAAVGGEGGGWLPAGLLAGGQPSLLLAGALLAAAALAGRAGRAGPA